MATRYCDHGAYAAYAATPTWNTPQDGDGQGTGTGACALGSVVFTQGHATGSVAVFGASVTPATSASADAAANNLATAINASTANISATFSGGPTTSQLRNVVYARGPAGGAPAGTCQIMTRFASALLNDSGNTSLTQASFDGTVPTLTQFSGGSSGAWGYLFNQASIWPQALGVYTYGVWGSSTGPLVGPLSAGDVVICRSNKSITITTANSVAPRAMGAYTAPITFIVDDGTVWSADGSSPVLQITWSNAAGYGLGISLNTANTFCRIQAKRYSSGVAGFKLFGSMSVSGTSGLQLSMNGGNQVIGVDMAATNAVPVTASFSDAYGGNRCRLADFKISAARDHNVFLNLSANSRCDVAGGELVATGSTTASNYAIQQAMGAGTAVIRNVKFTGFVIGSTLCGGANSNNTQNISFDDCDFGNVTNRGPFLGLIGATVPTNNQLSGHVAATLRRGNRDFFVDDFRGLVAWNSSKSQPTLAALLDDGSTPWSVMIQPTAQSNNYSPLFPIETPRFNKVNTLADGARTFTVHFLAESTLSVTKDRVSMLVFYTATDGSMVVLDTYDATGPACDTDSAAAWSSTSYQNGGAVAHSKYKLSVATPSGKNLAATSEIGLVFRVHKIGSTTTQTYFICPAFDIA